MADLYNLTAVTNGKGIIDLIIAANNAYPTGYGQGPQFLVGGMVVAIFIVMVFLLRKHDFVDSMLASSFICFILALFMRSATGLSFMYALVFIFLMGVAGFLKVVMGHKPST